MSDFVLIPYPVSGAVLILSDGQRTMDLLGTPPDGLYLVEFNPPMLADENTFASSPDMEGGTRTRTKPVNPTGSGLLRVDESQGTELSFWSEIDDLQDLVREAHRKKGTIAYTPPGSSTQVIFDLEAISLPEMGHSRGYELVKRRMEIAFEFTCKPYARLTPEVIVEEAEIGVAGATISYVDLEDVGGHVDALGEMLLTIDVGGVVVLERIQWGLTTQFGVDDVYSIDADDFAVYDDALTYDTGAVVLDDSAFQVEVSNVGPHRLIARLVADDPGGGLYVEYRVNDDLPRPLPPVVVPDTGGGVGEIDLGLLNFREAAGAVQVGTVAVFSTGGVEIDVYALELVPAERHGVAIGHPNYALVSANYSPLRIDHRTAERFSDVSGWSEIASYQGQRFKIPPATRNNEVSRLVIKQDYGSDPMTLTVTATPRVLLTS